MKSLCDEIRLTTDEILRMKSPLAVKEIFADAKIIYQGTAKEAGGSSRAGGNFGV